MTNGYYKLYGRSKAVCEKNCEVKQTMMKAKNEAWENYCREIDKFIGGTKTKIAWERKN